jgi:hypothetical protein
MDILSTSVIHDIVLLEDEPVALVRESGCKGDVIMHKRSTKRAKAPAGMKATPGDKRTARPKGGAIERGFKDRMPPVATLAGGSGTSGASKRREKRLMGRAV